MEHAPFSIFTYMKLYSTASSKSKDSKTLFHSHSPISFPALLFYTAEAKDIKNIAGAHSIFPFLVHLMLLCNTE